LANCPSTQKANKFAKSAKAKLTLKDTNVKQAFASPLKNKALAHQPK
jgi:hypothetical protein